MHEIKLRPDLIANVILRRGREHPFEEFDPATTALVVVDMQNHFVAEGYQGRVATATEIVPNINRIASGLRAAGGVVVWLQTAFDDDTARTWSTFFESFNTDKRRAGVMVGLKKDSDGYQLWPELEGEAADLKIEKDRFSAFIQGASDLHDILQTRAINTLLITGTVTNVCCEATARDASMLNYKTVMVADGNAAPSDDAHNASLNNLFGAFCDVLTTAQIIARIETVGSNNAQAAE
jgi:ureidoacrylate peracid hydrolase